MTIERIRPELARDKDYPDGGAEHGFEFRAAPLPLTWIKAIAAGERQSRAPETETPSTDRGSRFRRTTHEHQEHTGPYR